MATQVFAMNLRASLSENLFAKFGRLLDAVGFDQVFGPRHLVAVKLHFGEKGNTAYISPPFLRQIVERIRNLGGKPFLTDANTLYVGSRTNSVDHLTTAIENGFAYAVVGAPLTIADGLRGNSEVAVQVDLPIHKEVYIGADIVHADALISAAHFKGHELSGFDREIDAGERVHVDVADVIGPRHVFELDDRFGHGGGPDLGFIRSSPRKRGPSARIAWFWQSAGFPLARE